MAGAAAKTSSSAHPDRPSASSAGQGEQSADFFRDSIVRYLGFTSDLDESFKPYISRRLYLLSYGVVAAYGLADAMDKGRKAYRESHPSPSSAPTTSPLLPATAAGSFRVSAQGIAEACADCRVPLPTRHLAGSAMEQQTRAVPVAAAVLDAALWHSAASLVIPGVMINRAVWASSKALSQLPRVSPCVRALAPSAVGLALIPLAVPHIDEAVSHWMDKHVRPHLDLSDS